MREIEFRAKTIKDVRWIYGDLFKTGTDPSDEDDITEGGDNQGGNQGGGTTGGELEG